MFLEHYYHHVNSQGHLPKVETCQKWIFLEYSKNVKFNSKLLSDISVKTVFMLHQNRRQLSTFQSWWKLNVPSLFFPVTLWALLHSCCAYLSGEKRVQLQQQNLASNASRTKRVALAFCKEALFHCQRLRIESVFH